MSDAMKSETLMDALVLTKRMGNLLNEIMDLSQQMAEAVDRNDEVTVGMLISMRSEPMEKLKTADQTLHKLIDSLAGTEDGERLTSLLNGREVAEGMEEALAKQAASNTRLLEKIAALERILNQKITRDKSIFR